MKFQTRLIVASLAALAACGPLLPHISPMQAQWATQQWPDMTVERFEEARTVYTNRCTSCHNAVQPRELSLTKWEKMLNKMAPKAKLTAEQRELVWRYIVTAHDAPPDKK